MNLAYGSTVIDCYKGVGIVLVY